MNSLVELWERPTSGKYMIAGWHQWADAGLVSSGLPHYLIDETDVRKIGEIKPDGFYLFQIPGTHHLLRHVVKLEDGHRRELRERKNELFYSSDDENGIMIFLGEEPHQNEEQYAEAFFDAVEELDIKRVAAIGGVHAPVPYDKDRSVSCVYSLPRMKEELSKYAVRFSNYEGGTTICMYLAHEAELRGIEFFAFYALVPAYEISSPMFNQGISISEDSKAWYDIMLRLNHMFNLGMDLSDLERQSDELISGFDFHINHIASTMPQLGVRAYMERVRKEFVETSFVPISDVWENELEYLLKNL